MRRTKDVSDLYEDVNRQINEMLEKMFAGRLKYKIDDLDMFTNRHINRVEELTIKICRQIGLSDKDTKFCGVCAYFHDIGKILMPPRILQKTTRLTDKEYETIKKHTIFGYEICMLNENLSKYANAAKYHHENEDGSGYPDGLAGQEIPIEARIIKVADVYDAISSKRQYKGEVNRVDTLKRMNSELVEKGKVNKFIFNALLDVIIDEIRQENTVQGEAEIKKILKLCSNVYTVKKNESVVEERWA